MLGEERFLKGCDQRKKRDRGGEKEGERRGMTTVKIEGHRICLSKFTVLYDIGD